MRAEMNPKIYFDHRDIRLSVPIALTNGCFDILHVGHLRFLRSALEQTKGKAVLVVAVNDDGSVNRLKGDSRPVNNCADRMELLAALPCVGFVVPFSGDNVAQVIRDLEPQMWIKGAPYTRETLNQEEVAAADSVDCKIVILEKFGAYSTTEIIRRMKG